MAARSLFGGQPPEFKIDGAQPPSTSGSFPLVYDAATNEASFSDAPVIGAATASDGTTVVLSESGGSGTVNMQFNRAYQQLVKFNGDALINLTLSGGNSTANLTGGGTQLELTLPSDLETDPALVICAGVVTVNDVAGAHLCFIEVSGTALKVVRQSGTWSAGAWSIASCNITYPRLA